MADSDFLEFNWDQPSGDYGGGVDTIWADTSYEVPAYQDFEMPAYAADYDMGGDEQYYLPDLSLGARESIVPTSGAWNYLYGGATPNLGVGGGFESGQASGYDPSTGTFFDRAGNPITPQGASATGGEADQEEFLRRGSPSPYGSGSGYGGITPENMRGPGGNWLTNLLGVGGAAAGAAGAGAGGAGRGGGGAGGGGTDWGSILAKAGIGAAAIGAGRLMAGPAPKAPTLTMPGQSPTGQATEGALLAALNQGGTADLTRAAGQSIGGQADLSALLRQIVNQEQATETQMQPGFGDARMKALGLIPGQLDTSMDPVQAALQGELMKTMEGQANPIVEDKIRKDWAAMQNQMFQRLGPDWELSSAGQESKQAFDRSANMQRFQSRQDTISRLQPLQAQQQQVVGGERRANVASLTGATGMGRGDPYRAGTQMNTIAPVGAYLGGDPDRFRSLQANLETQSALLPYQAKQAERKETMAGVGQLGGVIAGSIGRRSLSDYL